jgi:hypothetical protein
MDYPWELVLDHSYAGVPGMIFDRSPARAGHGTAIGIADADFLIDGSAPRSGAVRLRGGKRSIRANLNQQWAVTGGVAIDIVCSSEAIEHNGTLIERPAIRAGGVSALLSTPLLDAQDRVPGLRPDGAVSACRRSPLWNLSGDSATRRLAAQRNEVHRIPTPSND